MFGDDGLGCGLEGGNCTARLEVGFRPEADVSTRIGLTESTVLNQTPENFCERADTSMDFPFEVVQVPGKDALKTLGDLRSQGRGYPVLLGSFKDVEILLENYEAIEESTDELLSAAEKIDAEEWLRARAMSDPDYYQQERGEWPDDVTGGLSITGYIDTVAKKPYREVAIALVPADESWKVPCHIKIGGWNECPFPPEHSAMFRRWHAMYGAEVVTVQGDTIEMRVERPPVTRDQALALASEQFIYCADIVSQGTQTIDALAAALLKSPVWFFWWD